MNAARKHVWFWQRVKILIAFTVLICLLLTIFVYNKCERLISELSAVQLEGWLSVVSGHQQFIRAMDLLSSDVSQCAYLNCSHSPQCTTSNTTCCAFVLKSMLFLLDTFFHRHNVSYVVAYGTLLGGVRNSTIIPWTHDVDIGFFDTTFLFSEAIRDDFYQHGYHLFKVTCEDAEASCHKP